jgi:hypothetical protein
MTGTSHSPTARIVRTTRAVDLERQHLDVAFHCPNAKLPALVEQTLRERLCIPKAVVSPRPNATVIGLSGIDCLARFANMTAVHVQTAPRLLPFSLPLPPPLMPCLVPPAETEHTRSLHLSISGNC